MLKRPSHDSDLGGDYLDLPRSGSEGSALFGLADLHCHWMAHLAFGGRFLWGLPDGPLAQALSSCRPLHGVCGLKPAGLAEGGPHSGSGFPKFRSWPNHKTIAHQQMYVDWVYRAWQGGLRLMVTLAINNQLLSALSGTRTDDLDSVVRQTEAIEEFANRHRHFLGVAKSASEARNIIQSGKLALVLGMEIDSHLDWQSNKPPAKSEITAYLDRLYRLGIRHVFPIHLANNIFGGAAVYHDLFDVLNWYLRGNGFKVRDGSEHNIQFRLGEAPLPLRAIRWATAGAGARRINGGHANSEGLTEAGSQIAIPGLMRLGMIVDIDHMSELAVAQTIQIARAFQYPLTAGHASFRDLAWRRGETANPYNLPNEYQRTRQHLQAIRELGGVVGIGLNQGDVRAHPGAAVLANDCAASAKSWAQAFLYAHEVMGGRGIAIGSDANGLAGLPGPRFGPLAAQAISRDRLRRTLRTAQCSAQKKPVSYRHGKSSQTGNAPLAACVAGERTFDINTDGMAHYGMLPDFLQDLCNSGMPGELLKTLFLSAEDYVQMWEKCEQQAAAIGGLGRPV